MWVRIREKMSSFSYESFLACEPTFMNDVHRKESMFFFFRRGSYRKCCAISKFWMDLSFFGLIVVEGVILDWWDDFSFRHRKLNHALVPQCWSWTSCLCCGPCGTSNIFYVYFWWISSSISESKSAFIIFLRIWRG